MASISPRRRRIQVNAGVGVRLELGLKHDRKLRVIVGEDTPPHLVPDHGYGVATSELWIGGQVRLAQEMEPINGSRSSRDRHGTPTRAHREWDRPRTAR